VPTYPFKEMQPRVDPGAFVAPGARVVGDVEIGAGSSVWFNAVVRGDSAHVRVGRRTNIQDGAVLHTDSGQPCEVGDDCTVGHLAIVHGARVGDGCLIGMGAIVLSGVVIGDESLVAAGALVPQGREFGPRSLLVGSPVRHLRVLSDEEVEQLIRPGGRAYVQNVADYGRTLNEEDDDGR
jgi:carbonic anhydrase/acetyltransferase-like protein (isoleucine patch superfamily)